MLKYLVDMDHKALPERDIRLAFFDIDGTLLGVDGNYTKTLAEEIRRIQKRGVKTAIASGRPHFATDFLVAELGLDAPGVFYTGALVYSPGPREIIASATVDTEQVAAVIDYSKRHKIYCELYTLDRYYVESVTEITEVHSHHLRCPPVVCPFEEVLGTMPTFKLLIGVDGRKQPHTLGRMVAEFPHLAFAFARLPAYPNWIFASIVSPEADKERAFQLLLDYHQLKPENVIAFGDAESDCEFLRLAGTGIALGNASEAAMAAADYVTRPVWEDGVAYALSRLVPS